MNERNRKLNALRDGWGGYSVLLLIGSSSAALAYLLKHHAFGEFVNEGGAIYTRALLVAVGSVVCMIFKAIRL
jgi:hypothetical protein